MSLEFFPKLPTLKFVVKNVSELKKTISIFNLDIEYNNIADLFSLPNISESDIQVSLAKGELANKIRVGDIRIVENTLNLLTFDKNQVNFINDARLNEELLIGIDPKDLIGNNSNNQIIDKWSSFGEINPSFSYDENNLLLRIDYASGNYKLFYYNSEELLTQLDFVRVDGIYRKSFIYDGQDNLIRIDYVQVN